MYDGDKGVTGWFKQAAREVLCRLSLEDSMDVLDDLSYMSLAAGIDLQDWQEPICISISTNY